MLNEYCVERVCMCMCMCLTADAVRMVHNTEIVMNRQYTYLYENVFIIFRNQSIFPSDEKLQYSLIYKIEARKCETPTFSRTRSSTF